MALAIRAARLIDGTGQPPRRGVLILIEHNRFTVVSREEEAPSPPATMPSTPPATPSCPASSTATST